ncbi:hypothetical protein [uncultured Phascolarctobacterium sp.]|uniref:hypothetical protein n=1 Tax=uncultured Phascolarctobacterium sp. TaxID=512296 RepID=UPI0027D9BCBC|nr:hypothetical protein [uncultured Phascolarctobacterium sp.]
MSSLYCALDIVIVSGASTAETSAAEQVDKNAEKYQYNNENANIAIIIALFFLFIQGAPPSLCTVFSQKVHNVFHMR